MTMKNIRERSIRLNRRSGRITTSASMIIWTALLMMLALMGVVDAAAFPQVTETIESVVTVPGSQNTAIVRVTATSIAAPVTNTATTISTTAPQSTPIQTSAAPELPTQSASETESKPPPKVVIIAASIGGSLVLLAVGMGIYFLATKKKRRRIKSMQQAPMSSNYFDPAAHTDRRETTVPIIAPDPDPETQQQPGAAVTMYRGQVQQRPYIQPVQVRMGEKRVSDGTILSDHSRTQSGGSNPSSYGLRMSSGHPMGHQRQSNEMHLWKDPGHELEGTEIYTPPQPSTVDQFGRPITVAEMDAQSSPPAQLHELPGQAQ